MSISSSWKLGDPLRQVCNDDEERIGIVIKENPSQVFLIDPFASDPEEKYSCGAVSLEAKPLSDEDISETFSLHCWYPEEAEAAFRSTVDAVRKTAEYLNRK